MRERTRAGGAIAERGRCAGGAIAAAADLAKQGNCGNLTLQRVLYRVQRCV